MNRVAVVGAGVLGRCLALEMKRRQWKVSMFEERPRDDLSSCSASAAGMLCPTSETETATALVSKLGIESLALWPKLLARLETPVFFKQHGCLVVSHPQDRDQLDRFRGGAKVSARGLRELEPELNHFSDGLYFSEEGQIDNREFLAASTLFFESEGVELNFGTRILEVRAQELISEKGNRNFDLVIDARGLKARQDWQGLRGVRGELVYLFAPEVELTRPVRLVHPRYPLYVVPRRDSRYVVGATMLETEDEGEVQLEAILELLSGAFFMHSGFARARVLELVHQCRPALPDHDPQLQLSAGLIRVNGLYRHGFLVSPRLAELVADAAEGLAAPAEYQRFFSTKEESHDSRLN